MIYSGNWTHRSAWNTYLYNLVANVCVIKKTVMHPRNDDSRRFERNADVIVDRSSWLHCKLPVYTAERWSLATLPWTYPKRNKMAAILQTTCSNVYSWMKIFLFWLQFHYFFSMGQIDNGISLFQVMALCRTGEQALSEPMIASLLVRLWVFKSRCVKPWRLRTSY